MLTASITITGAATPELARIRNLVKRPAALMAVAGKRGEKHLRGHFLKKNSEGNAQGWPRSNFWNKRVRQATSFAGSTDTTAEIRIASPELAHKITGGKVTAKRSKFLAIPLTAKAKAAGSPREGGWGGNDLVLTPTADKSKMLLREALASTIGNGKRRITGGEAQYILLRSVTHKADPTAMPPQAEFEAAIEDEAGKFYLREVLRS